MFMAENHAQFILEVALIIHVGILFLFNIVALPLSLVLFLGLVLTFVFAVVFGIDATFLILPYVSHHEFTHPFGPIAVFSWVTIIASANLLSEMEIRSTSIKALAVILFIVIAISGGLMHRSFLILWFVGLVIGMLLMSKSFKRSSRFSLKNIILIVGAGLAGFGILELLSRIFNYPVLSPLLRVGRLEQYALPNIKMVLKNAVLWGHSQGSCFWGSECLGGSCGYISLPMSVIHSLSLPYPLFYGILVIKKDYIDYMLPGIFAWAFDFGYAGLFFILSWSAIVMVTGLIVLRKYRTKRKNGSRMYLGREALLIGALSAFMAQTIVGLFLFTRTMNGAALLTYITLSALVMAHTITLKRTI